MAALVAHDEAAFSDLVNRPVKTVERLQRARNRTLRLKRRGDEDLVLVTASRAEQDSEVNRFATRVLGALGQSNADAELMSDIIMAAFPWVRLLPSEDAPAFVEDLVGALRSIEDLDTVAPVVQVIAAWRNTAAVYADAELATVVGGKGRGDFGPVEAPPAQ